jgi:hypothetical protein
MSNETRFLEETIQHITEQFLGIHHDPILKNGEWGNKKRRAIFFQGYIEIELPHDHKYISRLPYSDRPRCRRNFEFIITERHNVFVNWTQYGRNKFSTSPLIAADFVNTGNHDSCWCSMDYTKLHTNYQEMCEQLNTILLNNKFKPVAPIKMQVEVQLGDWIGNDPIRFCEVEVVPKNNDTYFLDLKSITLKKVTMDFIEE